MIQHRRAWLWLIVVLLVGAVSVHLRQRGVAAASSLGDAIHPWWSALQPGWPRAHAAPYGWGLVLPYWVSQLGAGSLWSATLRLLVWHAMVAPIAAVCAWRLGRPNAVAGLFAGLVVALDPGLIDTALSGAEGYLGAFWIGCLTLCVVCRDAPWAPITAGLCFAMAVMNHPLAVAAAPVLLCLRVGDRRTWLGLVPGLMLLVPHAIHLWSEAGNGGGGLGMPTDALPAYIAQGGATAWVIVAGPVVGLLSRHTRGVCLAALMAWLLMAWIGAEIGYLRDHHFRLLTVPALVGWSRAPFGLAVLCLLFVREPPHPVYPAGHLDRPGTVGLANLLTNRVAEESGPLVVDGAWLSGGPAAAPSAIMLDLYLRGWHQTDLAPGGSVVVLVSAERADMDNWPMGLEGLSRGDRHALLQGSATQVADWSRELCRMREEDDRAPPRFGGAWEALSVLHPALSTAQASAWWACPERSGRLAK